MFQLLRDHDSFYKSTDSGVFKPTDRVDCDFSQKLNAIIDPQAGIFFRQLFLQRTDAHLSFLYLFILSLAFLSITFLVSIGFFDFSRWPWYKPYAILLVMFSLITSIHVIAARCTSDSKYLLIQGKNLLVKGRRFGKKIYPIKDLKLIVTHDLIKPDPVCNLWVELPDPSLPDNDRKIMIESTANVQAMQGKLKSLLPLLCGDDKELKAARFWPYIDIPLNKWIFVNCFEHIRIPISRYLVSHMLFLAVHGTCRSILKKERLIIKSQLKQGVTHETRQ